MQGEEGCLLAGVVVTIVCAYGCFRGWDRGCSERGRAYKGCDMSAGRGRAVAPLNPPPTEHRAHPPTLKPIKQPPFAPATHPCTRHRWAYWSPVGCWVLRQRNPRHLQGAWGLRKGACIGCGVGWCDLHSLDWMITRRPRHPPPPQQQTKTTLCRRPGSLASSTSPAGCGASQGQSTAARTASGHVTREWPLVERV